MRAFQAVMLSALLGCALAKNYGETCKADSECTQTKTYCKIISASCGDKVGGGSCQCIPGFQLDGNDGTCKRSVGLGTKCGSNDVCSAQNSVCNGGTCACATGYKTGLKGNDCVSTLKTERYNGKCYDSVQCYYNLVCLNNQCTCYTGYKVVGDYECQERNIGDTCNSDDDCSRTPNSVCQGGQCTCQGGYKKVDYMSSESMTKFACINQGDSQVDQGGACNVTVGASGSSLCKKPYLCTSCGGSSSKCALINPPPASDATRQTVSVTASLVFLVMAILAL